MPDAAWRPLGELLIERGLIDAYELEHWLKQQKLTGMLLGELLVINRIVSPVEVAAALAVQRGADGVAGGIHEGPRQLGRILVEKELLTESGLQRALLAQRRHGGTLGDILVQRGYVSKRQIDEALAGDSEEQDAVGPEPDEAVDADRYQVHEPGSASPMYVADTFLDATDYAFELIEREDPFELEIVRIRPQGSEQVWSYSREASEAFRAQSDDVPIDA
jgi:hypothetical protein